MEHTRSFDGRLPEQQGSDRWRRIRQRLSQMTMRRMTQEVNGRMNGSSSGSRVPTGQTPRGGQTGQPTALAIFNAAYKAHRKATENEAGRSEGRIFPELDIGAQRYPNPDMWGPDTGGVPLTVDKDYKKSLI